MNLKVKELNCDIPSQFYHINLIWIVFKLLRHFNLKIMEYKKITTRST